MSGILRSTPGGSQSATPSRPRTHREKNKGMRPMGMRTQERIREPKVYAAVQRAPIPLAKSANVSKRETMLADRSQDLRAVHATTEKRMRRWFRMGELVWCALNPPITGPGDVAITFWPGLVDEYRLKSKSIPRESAAPALNHSEQQVSHPNGGDVVVENDDIVPWTVQQSTTYKIQLLAVTQSYVVADDQVLPYQAHVPPNNLITALQSFPPHKLDFSRDTLSRFNPCPGEGPQSDFEEAVAPYAMAVQIGSALSGFWNLTDEWAFDYITPKPTIHRSEPWTTSVAAALEAASVHNSQANTGASASHGPSSSSQFYSVSGPSPNMSTAELQKLSARMIGKPPPARPAEPSKHHTQIRFQGLWWGAERIWVDEFIRLKVPRRCLAPRGAECIFPPSGPGKSAHDMWLASGRDLSEIGAGARGVFMRLEALFVVDAVQPDGFTKKECRASGMLYELADIDWEDPEAVGDSGSMAVVNDAHPVSQSPRTTNAVSSAGTSQLATSSKGSPKPDLSKPTSKTKVATPNDQLSHPAEYKYRLPPAPLGYRFRPILPKGHEAVVSLSLISGRYYPEVLAHPLLGPTLQEAIANPLEQGGLLESNNLWALEGLSAGYYNSVDPTVYKTSRAKMVEDADRTAARELEEHRQTRLEKDTMQLDDDGAEVDALMYPDPMDVDTA